MITKSTNLLLFVAANNCDVLTILHNPEIITVRSNYCSFTTHCSGHIQHPIQWVLRALYPGAKQPRHEADY